MHQVQLEMQNEEVQRARNELEAGFEKYSDLYDFAPVGHLTLDPAGAVREANLANATLIGIERSRLLQRLFAQHLVPGDLTRFAGFLQRVFGSRARETCEVTLLRDGLPPAAVRLCAAAAAAGRECRVVLEDITTQKQAEADRFLLRRTTAWPCSPAAWPMTSTTSSPSSCSTSNSARRPSPRTGIPSPVWKGR